MLNTTTLMGRLTDTPELKTTPGGVSVTNFTLAVERDFKDKETGEKVTDFIDCVAWSRTADFVTRFFTKGRMAVVCGSIQTRKYTDKDGNNRRATEIKVEKAYFGDSNNGNRGAENGDNNQTGGWTEVPDGEGLPFDLPM